MLIDWFTVFAQLLNFAILVVALKFLLYDRIVKAMDQRRRTIAEQESSAAALAREAEEELARLRAERRELDRTREEILDEARAQAAAQQRKLLQQAREDVDRQAQEWRESLRNHQHALLSHLQRTTGRRPSRSVAGCWPTWPTARSRMPSSRGCVSAWRSCPRRIVPPSRRRWRPTTLPWWCAPRSSHP